MSIFRRKRKAADGTTQQDTYYSFNFWHDGKHIQRPTKATHPKVARRLEAACRIALSEGKPWPPAPIAEETCPTLLQFCETRILPWARATFESTTPRSWLWYRVQCKAICGYAPLAKRKLGSITSEHAADFAAYRESQGMAVSTVNSALRMLRRVLRLAVEWGAAPSCPAIKLRRGERHRDTVVLLSEEAKYLAAASEPLASVSAVLADTGLRVGELLSMEWPSVSFDAGRFGALQVFSGKSSAAKRRLPLTPRVRSILLARWQDVGCPAEGFIFPAPTRSGHLEPSSLKKQHRRALTLSGVRRFTFHGWRHTFLTRLGTSGVDAWTLAKIAGHGSTAVTSRYVHSSQDDVLNAMQRFQDAGALPALPAAQTH